MKRTVAASRSVDLPYSHGPAHADQVERQPRLARARPDRGVGRRRDRRRRRAVAWSRGAVAHYDKQELMRAGALRASTTRLVASDGSDVVGRAQRDARGQARAPVVRGASRAGPLRGALRSRAWSSGVDVDRLAAKARARTGGARSPMEQWHRVELPAGVDASAVAARAARAARGELRLPGGGRRAAAADHQRRRRSPPCRATCGPRRVGTDNDFSLQDPRTRGAGVRIADLEYYWTPDHEDLQLDPVAADLGGTAYPQYRNFADEHGTAVFGEMVGKDNGFGVTGGVPDASMHGISPTRARRDRQPAVHPVRGARLRRPVPLARGRRPARAADRRPQRRHALRAAGVEPGQLRRDQDALRPRHRRRRDRRQRQRGSRLRADAWAASTARCATPARSSSAPATPPPAPR